MIIYLKNKHTLEVDDFKFRCSIGKNGKSKKKVEGDKKTPKGVFSLGSLFYRKDRNKRMEFHIFKHLVDDGIKRGLKAINLSYVNEPMIRKDLPKFVKYAMDAGIVDTYFSSNATLVRENMIRELIEAGLCRVQFSIDATTQETYDKIRVGGKYNKVLD